MVTAVLLWCGSESMLVAAPAGVALDCPSFGQNRPAAAGASG